MDLLIQLPHELCEYFNISVLFFIMDCNDMESPFDFINFSEGLI